MKETITKYFLLGTVLLATLFAFAMKATVFQAAQPPKEEPGNKAANASADEWGAYWFSGKAEISSYMLEQAQYGALNPGTAVLIFVTEDFRTDTQVKSEMEASRSKSTPVLKLNMAKKFITGIYDYSMFMSVFTPIRQNEFPYTLKVSASAQEWCGHSYTQLNYRNGGYQVLGRSYFEQEVTEDYETSRALLEDELWNRIRLAPDKLPSGTVQMIPGAMFARLRHQKLEPLTAEITRQNYTGKAFSGNNMQALSVDYKTNGRKLTIVFEASFPHRIVGWEGSYATKGKVLTTRAVLQKTIQTDYWNRNAPADTVLRRSLNL